MELVATSFSRNHYLAATAASECRVVVAALQGEFLDGVDTRRIQKRAVRAAVVDVSTVYGVVVRARARSVDGDAGVVRKTESNFVRQCVGNTRLQQNELLEVSIVQREFADLLSRHSAGLLGCRRLDGAFSAVTSTRSLTCPAFSWTSSERFSATLSITLLATYV